MSAPRRSPIQARAQAPHFCGTSAKPAASSMRALRPGKSRQPLSGGGRTTSERVSEIVLGQQPDRASGLPTQRLTVVRRWVVHAGLFFLTHGAHAASVEDVQHVGAEREPTRPAGRIVNCRSSCLVHGWRPRRSARRQFAATRTTRLRRPVTPSSVPPTPKQFWGDHSGPPS